MDHYSSTTSADVRQRQPPIAVLPIGSFEQHGDYLPLATDTAVAVAIARQLATTYNVLELPAITISCSHEHAGWPGTVSISHITLSSIITDIASSLVAQGIHRLALVSGHGGNYVLSNITQETNASRPASMTLFPTHKDWERAREAAGLASNAHDDMHAGELEVSILAATWPDAVQPGAYTADHTATERSMLLVHGMAAYTASGVIGQPSAATIAKGNVILTSLTELFADHLAALRIART
ncbi:creatininase family protein [Actinoplanes sp. NPDC026619]|uniref:creatininase family protein n=1 Tax=Actinoplanes sp. NPDC026619 TaxID=3155798 RepID=UPI0033DCB4C9